MKNRKRWRQTQTHISESYESGEACLWHEKQMMIEFERAINVWWWCCHRRQLTQLLHLIYKNVRCCSCWSDFLFAFSIFRQRVFLVYTHTHMPVFSVPYHLHQASRTYSFFVFSVNRMLGIDNDLLCVRISYGYIRISWTAHTRSTW